MSTGEGVGTEADAQPRVERGHRLDQHDLAFGRHVVGELRCRGPFLHGPVREFPVAKHDAVAAVVAAAASAASRPVRARETRQAA